MIDKQRDAEVAIVGLGVIGGSAALRMRERGTPVRGFTTSARDRAEAEKAAASALEIQKDHLPARWIRAQLYRDRGDLKKADVEFRWFVHQYNQALMHAARLFTGHEIWFFGFAGVLGYQLNRLRTGRISLDVVPRDDSIEKHPLPAPPRATILHAGSLQREAALGALPEIAARLVGTHPLAGSHESGFAGARADLFRAATVFVERRADPRQREDAELFWSLAGARHIEYATASAHDDAMAWISHLPQLASNALGATLAAAAAEAPNDRPRVPLGPGARDATRLALSPVDMWQPILERAPAATLEALRSFEGTVHRLRIALEEQNWAELRELWESASRWRIGAEHGEVT